MNHKVRYACRAAFAALFFLLISSCGSGRPESIYELARRCLECQIDYTYIIHRLRPASVRG